MSTVPPVLDSPLQESLNYTLGSHAALLCEASGVPVPSITWLKDGAPIGRRRLIIGGGLKYYLPCVTASESVFTVQRAVCRGIGLFEGTGWSWGLSLSPMLEHTPVWLKTERDTHRKTSHSQCRVRRRSF